VTLRSDRRGVSEAISFVLIFSLIVTSVGLVYTVGAQELVDVRDYERLNNAERAFDVFADNVEDISRRGAPSRGTEIKLADASLRFADDATINVTADFDNESANPARDFATGSIGLSPAVFEVADAGRIRYSTGAVLRDDGPVGDAVVVRRPNALFGPEGALVPIVAFDPRGSTAVSGSQTVRIRTELAYREVLFVSPAEAPAYDEVRVNVTSPYADAWIEYFESEGLDCALEPATASTPPTAACTAYGVDRVTVTYVELTTTLE
jgi:hypothetical protein